jgi:hypothetical protein
VIVAAPDVLADTGKIGPRAAARGPRDQGGLEAERPLRVTVRGFLAADRRGGGPRPAQGACERHPSRHGYHR